MSFTKTFRFSRIGVLAASAMGLMAMPASAPATGPSVVVKVRQASGVASSYFQLQSRPGARVKAGYLELLNPTKRTMIVRVNPVGGITTNALGSAYALRGGTHGSAAWLRLSARRVKIAPRGRSRIDVSVAAPKAARPGDYLTGVAVEALGQDKRGLRRTGQKRRLALGEIYRYAVGVQLSLPGPRRPSVHFTGAQVHRDPAGVAFRIGVRNNGNVILKKVTGHATVTRNGRVVARASIGPGTFVSNTSIRFPVAAYRQHPPAGTVYRVQASMTYAGGTARLDRTVTFGKAAAAAQATYGGPRVAPHHSMAVYIAALAALALAVPLGLVWRSRRRLPRRAAALAFLERELAVAHGGGRPLSVIHLDVPNPSRAFGRRIVHALRDTLRKPDLVYDLDRDGLLVALPCTGPTMAGELASEIRDALQAVDVQSVGVPASTDGIDPHELIAKALL